jgi:hypothetical protein
MAAQQSGLLQQSGINLLGCVSAAVPDKHTVLSVNSKQQSWHDINSSRLRASALATCSCAAVYPHSLFLHTAQLPSLPLPEQPAACSRNKLLSALLQVMPLHP